MHFICKYIASPFVSTPQRDLCLILSRFTPLSQRVLKQVSHELFVLSLLFSARVFLREKSVPLQWITAPLNDTHTLPMHMHRLYYLKLCFQVSVWLRSAYSLANCKQFSGAQSEARSFHSPRFSRARKFKAAYRVSFCECNGTLVPSGLRSDCH